ncbi:peptidase associated/transthyretin-like domain-containing protein [Pedobacter montanisoli]|uniref:Carboxypeptidase-like regulatory domain-containing protein n=1 Tax=Pedobacter montanisoli TaxID=2923277 RepID=A0ABS9ZUF3_9SPHI|nr:hypothetical protein [Pedobacter montanisoli]MCJ0742240.1 hypothetical protein [Pedobacter montanisoli]
MLRKLLFILLTFAPFFSMAQQTYLTGNIFDNEKRSVPLEGVSVRNLSTKAFVFSDKDGHFAIGAKTGDLITFGMMGYETDTVYLINLFPKNIYLRASVNTLNTVNVTTAKISPFLDTKDPNATPARRIDYSKEKGGIGFNLGYGKYKRQQAKVRELEEQDELLTEINDNFNEKVILDLTKYKGKDIKDFIGLYRPTPEQIKAEHPFNYPYYIVKSFHEWLKLPPEARKLPALPKLKAN